MVWLQVADVRQQQAHMDLHRRQAATLVPLGQVAGSAVAKQRACMRSPPKLHLDVRDFALQAQLGLLNGGRHSRAPGKRPLLCEPVMQPTTPELRALPAKGSMPASVRRS